MKKTTMAARWASLAVVAMLALTTAVASADPEAAEALFEAGRADMADENYAAACPKFEKSRELDPALGTLLNLALCYKRSGRTASSWRVYGEAAKAADAAKQGEHAALARDEAAALEPTLHKVTITVAAAAPQQRVALDGRVLRSGELGIALPIDPGEHVVVVEAPRHQPFRVAFTSKSGTHAVAVPELAVAATGTAPTESAPKEPTSPSSPGDAPELMDDASTGLGGQRIAAIVLGVVGVGGVVVGAVFMGRRSGQESNAEPLCNAEDICHPAGVTFRENAASAGTIAIAGFAAGGAALVAAVVLWVTGSNPTERVSFGPILRAPGVGLTARW